MNKQPLACRLRWRGHREYVREESFAERRVHPDGRVTEERRAIKICECGLVLHTEFTSNALTQIILAPTEETVNVAAANILEPKA